MVVALSDAQLQTATDGIPAGALAYGFTTRVINELPVAADVGLSGGVSKWYDALWYSGAGSLTGYSTVNGELALTLGKEMAAVNHNTNAGLLPLLSGSKGFYVEFDVRLSSNDPDHWPAVWLMPREHNQAQEDHYSGDPEGFQRWMELDVDEGGFGVGLHSNMIDWTGISPSYVQVHHAQTSGTPLDRTQKHRFGASYDPTTSTVQWWLDGVPGHRTSGCPAVAAQQHFYPIITANHHGGSVPYTLYLSRVRAYTR